MTGELIKKIKKGLEVFGLYYSDYQGKVTSNEDPDGLGRIQVVCPELYERQTSPWVRPKSVPNGKNWGLYMIPQEGDMVWISCKGGSPRFPLYSYGSIIQGYGTEFNTKNFSIVTPSGYTLIFDEENKNISIKYNKDIHISLNESEIEIKHTERNIKVNKDNVLLDGDDFYAVRGSIKSQLEKNSARVTGIMNAIKNGVPAAGDGGAAFKTSMVLLLEAIVVQEDYSQILSDKVKLS